APCAHPVLHACPTRRSSDLAEPMARTVAACVAFFASSADFSSRSEQPWSRDLRSSVCLGEPELPLLRLSLFSRGRCSEPAHCALDRKSTRLNSSHVKISYAV